MSLTARSSQHRCDNGFRGKSAGVPRWLGDGHAFVTGAALALRAVGGIRCPTDGRGRSPHSVKRRNVWVSPTLPRRCCAMPAARAAGIGDDRVRIHVEDDAAHAELLADRGYCFDSTVRVPTPGSPGTGGQRRRDRRDAAIGDLAVAPEDRRPVPAGSTSRRPTRWTGLRLAVEPRSGCAPSPTRGPARRRDDGRTVQGTAVITSRQAVATANAGETTIVFVTRIEGVVDPLIIVGGEVTTPSLRR